MFHGSKILGCAEKRTYFQILFYYLTFLKILSFSKLPDFPVANRGHGKSKSLIHVFSVARQEADLLVPLEPYKFPIKGQRL